jgi:hypothetical protein
VVTGILTIQRADTIEKVERKDLVELSPGYTCTIDKTPGVYKGERYDQIQRNIVYNHIALGSKGWGRQGAEIAVKMDGAEDVAVQRFDITPVIPGPEPKGYSMKKVKIRIDGITYEVEIAESLATTFVEGVNKLDAERADAKKALVKAEADLVVASKERDEIKVKLDSATSPEALEAAVKERSDLIAKAKELAPEIKCDGKDTREIKVEALEVAGYERATFDGKEDLFVDGVFMAAQPKAKPPTPSIGVGGQRQDSKKDDKEARRYDSEKAHAEMLDRNAEAWKQDLSATKN